MKLFCGILILASAITERGYAQDQSSEAIVEIAKESAAEERAVSSEEEHWQKRVDGFFRAWCVAPLNAALFFDLYTGPWTDSNGIEHPGWLGTSVPFIVAWLIGGAAFLTVRMGFINIRAFVHAIRSTRGDFDNPTDEGEVTHFQALSSALSATVGLGNIAGVAIAVSVGGPGAIVWMILAGLLGMTSKFTECTLAQLYRKIRPDGLVSGGPMRYLQDALKELGFSRLGRVLSILFAVLCIGASFGAGCAFQVSQSLNLVRAQVPTIEQNVEGVVQEVSVLHQREWIYGLVMVLLVGIVIVGGIHRIAATAEKIVPLMCLIYVLAAAAVIVIHLQEIPAALGIILREAFSWNSAYGGILGVMIQGFRRAAFSNEAGTGSAAIAHSAAKTDEPVREGIVALLEPFIDTVVICTMTGLVIVVSGVYDTARYPEFSSIIETNQGALLTSKAFAQVFAWFPNVLTVTVVLFAYSSMIAWSYYGERCFSFLFGEGRSLVYRCMFLIFVFLGAIVEAPNVLEFSDLMLLSMAFPNMLGLVILSNLVKKNLNIYWNRYGSA